MNPRRYEAPQRRSAAEATRRRIVDAVIALHAEQGVTRTTYAQIAARADVAIPTVYNHFPALGDLLAACTGDVLAAAPPLGPEIVAAADDLDGRLAALARAFCAFYRYTAPWLRWSVHEAVLVREIAQRFAGMAERRCRLIELALEPAFGRRPPPPLVALADILLDFPAWQRLAREERDPDRQAAVLATALCALACDHLVGGGAPAIGNRRGRSLPA